MENKERKKVSSRGGYRSNAGRKPSTGKLYSFKAIHEVDEILQRVPKEYGALAAYINAAVSHYSRVSPPEMSLTKFVVSSTKEQQ